MEYALFKGCFLRVASQHTCLIEYSQRTIAAKADLRQELQSWKEQVPL